MIDRTLKHYRVIAALGAGVTLREASVLAAEEGRSVGALLSGLLAGLVRDQKAFHRALRRAARLRHGLDLQRKPPSDRHSVHHR